MLKSIFKGKIIFFIVILGLLIIGTVAYISFSDTDKDVRSIEVSYLEKILPEPLLPFGHIEVPSLRYLKVVEENNQKALGLRASEEEKLKNRARAEISIDYPYQEGDRVLYTWEYKVDPDMAYTYLSQNASDWWWLIAQWHDQPDPTKGETWDEFPLNSPLIAFGFGNLRGEDTISFIYGLESKALAFAPFTKGVWYTLSLEILWSRGPQGHATFYLDGKEVVSGEGQNMHNAYQHYFKAGSYRSDKIIGDGWVYLRNIQIKKLK